MIGSATLLQLPHFALRASAAGVQTYMDDMDRMRTVLSTAPQAVSWWTFALLALIVLSWFTALIAGWNFLNHRVRRSVAASQTETEPAQVLADYGLPAGQVAVAGAGRLNSLRKRFSAALSP